MSDDLVERVARAMMRAEPWSSFWSEADAEKLASTAVALALEEAAKVADATGSYDAIHIAAAIRALKEEK